MRVLLDTNIIIHREANRTVNQDIGVLFNWLDRLRCNKVIHPGTIDEIRKHQNKATVSTFEVKLDNYNVLQTLAPEVPEIANLRILHDQTENDSIDTSLLKEVYCKRVDILITEDRDIHAKASILGINERVFTIDDYLEKVVAENPSLANYDVLAVKKDHFGNLNRADSFFDSFKEDYAGFEEWFNRKSDEIAYVCKAGQESLLAFLYLKLEDEGESYHDIAPVFAPKRRLKIGTLKVILNGYKLGERFLKIVFDNALQYRVDEIYVTLFNNRPDQKILMNLLEDWGFEYHGVKRSDSGEESVYVKDFLPTIDTDSPAKSYPYISVKNRKFIVPIYPERQQLPDSTFVHQAFLYSLAVNYPPN